MGEIFCSLAVFREQIEEEETSDDKSDVLDISGKTKRKSAIVAREQLTAKRRFSIESGSEFGSVSN